MQKKEDGRRRKCRPVYCITLDKTYGSLKEAAEDLGLCTSSLCNHLKGKYKTCGGYIWCYVDETICEE